MNEKQERFCQEYAKDLSAGRAAVRAGYSPNTAESQGSRLLRNDKVKQKIAELLKGATDKAAITLNDVIRELKIIMLVDLSQIATWQGNMVTMKSSAELTPEALRAVESVATTSSKDGTPQLRVKLHSKLRAAELLIRIFEIQEVEARLAVIERELGLTT